MINYKKVYTNYFGYVEQDIIPSEKSGQPANHIHHIVLKSHGGKDVIENLIALTNREHQQAHRLDKEKFISEEELSEIHKRFMDKTS